MAFTWGDLRHQIKWRLNRTDLSDSFVETMMRERIDFFGPQVLAAAEETNYDIVTNPGQFFYALPTGTQKVNQVRVLYNGIWIPVGYAERYEVMLNADPLQPPFTSLPVTMYYVLGKNIRLFPTPNGQYPVELTIERTIQPPPKSTDTSSPDDDSTNFWVTDGRILLINATCAEICREYLEIGVPNSPRIMNFDRNTDEALMMLLTQAHTLATPSLMKQYI